MNNPDKCPHCSSDLRGEPIPEHLHKYYDAPYYWRREIGIEYPDKYDGIWEWRCPDCLGTWPAEIAKENL